MCTLLIARATERPFLIMNEEDVEKNKKEIKSIDLKIQNEALIINFLENIYKNISFSTNDIKNLIELMKLETQ